MDSGMLSECKKTVGLRESLKVIDKGLAEAVFIAKDAEGRIVQSVLEACRAKGIPVCEVDSMSSLGRECGIQVGTAVAACLKK